MEGECVPPALLPVSELEKEFEKWAATSQDGLIWIEGSSRSIQLVLGDDEFEIETSPPFKLKGSRIEWGGDYNKVAEQKLSNCRSFSVPFE